jgi:hypothetical protein
MTATAPLMRLRTPSLFGDCAITDAVNALASAGIEERGAVFTRREVVEFILDLVGYTADRPLMKLRMLEPSFGGGDFLIPAIDRLLECWTAAGRPEPHRAMADAIRAVELHRRSFDETRRKVVAHLKSAGINRRDAQVLADQWLDLRGFPADRPARAIRCGHRQSALRAAGANRRCPHGRVP